MPDVRLVLDADHELTQVPEANVVLDHGVLLLEHLADHRGGVREPVDALADVELVDKAVDPLVIHVVPVVGELAAQVEPENQAAGDRKRQARKVDRGVELVAVEGAQRDSERGACH